MKKWIECSDSEKIERLKEEINFSNGAMRCQNIMALSAYAALANLSLKWSVWFYLVPAVGFVFG